MGDYFVKDIAYRLQTIKVLIAEDDKIMSKLVRDVLRMLGFQDIHIAHDGEQALEMLRAQKFDIFICDWKMKPVDGITIVRALRQDKEAANQRIPVIMLTGKAEVADIETARDAGVTEYLIKPFEVKQLCTKIKEVIENPRNFVVSEQYTGPERRRHGTENMPEGFIDRRRPTPPEKQ